MTQFTYTAMTEAGERVSGALEGPSSYLMKSPPKQIVDDEAYEQSEEFIKRYHRKTATQPSKA